MRAFELHDLRWLWTKLRRRIESRNHDRRVREAAAARAEGTREPVATLPALPWATDAAPPGNAAMLPVTAPVDVARLALATEACEHRIAILAPQPFDINRVPPERADALRGIDGIPASTLAGYRRLDWHRDFRSGHRWDPQELYLDVRVAPVPGADIKVPRELSRFQHVGALASLPGERGAHEFLLQMLDWIDANPVGRGVNWACTMDVALRVVNWIWGLRLFEHVLDDRFAPGLRIVAESIREHGKHIEDNLEYYEECTGNHYLADIAGLVYIGAAFPRFPESDRWLLFGLQELVSEMQREVYADGFAHEASTHYHRLVAELFASCAAVAERVPAARRLRLGKVDRSAHRVRPRLRAPQRSGLNLEAQGTVLPPTFYSRLALMAEFTWALTKPNGLVPQVGDNDSARAHKLPGAGGEVRDHRHLSAVLGELFDRSDLRERAGDAAGEGSLIAGDLRGRVPPPARPRSADAVRLFADAGMAVARAPDAWVLFTCGQNGQGGRGGHGHNDKNSFELNVHGVDFIVDGGCPFYTSAPDVRNRFRATAAHNTISVEGLEQDRWTPGVAGLFRLPQRSRPELAIHGDSIVGRHAGFGAVHERRLRLENRRLLLDDRLESSAARWIHFNLDPSVVVESLDASGDSFACDLVHAGGVRVRLSLQGVTDAEVGPGTFGQGFGCPVPNYSVRARLLGASVRSEISWS